MLDQYNRKINYLRISVTDRCNLSCLYCMPGDEINRFEKGDILSFEEIIKVAETGARMGISKVRLTGGEPLVRKNISDLVSMLNKVPGIDEVTMTTNGILLSKVALKLKRAGLNRVNISLDSVSP